jgi:hypothetical protein
MSVSPTSGSEHSLDFENIDIHGTLAFPAKRVQKYEPDDRVSQAYERLQTQPWAAAQQRTAQARLQAPLARPDPAFALRIPTSDQVRKAVGRPPEHETTRLFGLYRYEHDKNYRKLESALATYEQTRSARTVDELRNHIKAIEDILEVVDHYDRKWFSNEKSKGILKVFDPDTYFRLSGEAKIAAKMIDAISRSNLAPSDVSGALKCDPVALYGVIRKLPAPVADARLILASAGVPPEKLLTMRISPGIALKLARASAQGVIAVDDIPGFLRLNPGELENALQGLSDGQLREALVWIRDGAKPQVARELVAPGDDPSAPHVRAASQDGQLPRGAFITAMNSPVRDLLNAILEPGQAKYPMAMQLLAMGVSPEIVAYLPSEQFNNLTQATNSGTSLSAAWEAIDPSYKLTETERVLFDDEYQLPITADTVRDLQRSENVTKIASDTLKGGAYSQPRFVTIREPDGQLNEKVFKPWQAGTEFSASAEDQGIRDDQPFFEQRNILSMRLAQALGWNQGEKKVVPNASYGIVGGQFGLVMDKVPGGASVLRRLEITGEVVKSWKPFRKVYNRFHKGKLSQSDMDTFARSYKVRLTIEKDQDGRQRLMAELGRGAGNMTVARDWEDPVLQKGLARLQLFDCLAGQGDRHPGNVFIGVGADGKVNSVIGIDNDISFGKKVRGIEPKPQGFALIHAKGMPSVIDSEMAEAVLQLNPETLHPTFIGPDAEAEFDAFKMRVQIVKSLITKAKNNRLKKGEPPMIIQPNQWGSKAVSLALYRGSNYHHHYRMTDALAAIDYGVPDPSVL